MKMKIISIIISIIGAICLGLCISGIINHIVNCKLEGTSYSEQICIIDGSGPSTQQFKYHYSIADQHSNEIIIIVTFIIVLICIISTLFLKLKSKIIPLIYTIITSIILYEYNSLGRDAVYINDNIIASQYNELYDNYCIKIIIILVIITILYIIKLIKDYKDYKKENS